MIWSDSDNELRYQMSDNELRYQMSDNELRYQTMMGDDDDDTYVGKQVALSNDDGR